MSRGEVKTMTTSNCLACGSLNADGPVCAECSCDPFMMEEARKQAAKSRSLENVERLYSPAQAFLKQGSVDQLWNDILAHEKDSIPDFTEWRNRISVSLIPAAVKRVLEVGIGSGHAVHFLQKRFPGVEIYGTDVSSRAIARASSLFRGTFATAPVGVLPWPELKFDAILMLEVLEHIEAPRVFATLRWLRSLLSESGVLIVSVPLESVADLKRSYFVCPHCGDLVHPIGHVRSYSDLEPIRFELEQSGFLIERIQWLAGGKYFGIPRQWLRPLFPKRITPMVAILRCRVARRTA
jgi:2-polyprenyl-3-methyl-5-hydroxy-6-metoxy-1,4-benzoquinol methylase